MAELEVQELDARIFSALGIRGRAAFRPMLREGVSIVVQVPLGAAAVAAQSSLGFNDAETDLDHAFGYLIVVAPVAAQLSHAQVFNPAASGKLVYVDGFEVWSTGGGDNFLWGFVNAAFANDLGNFANKNGGAAAVHKPYYQQSGSMIGTAIGGVGTNAGGVGKYVRCDPPFKIPVGRGFAVACSTVNLGLIVGFDTREYAAS